MRLEKLQMLLLVTCVCLALPIASEEAGLLFDVRSMEAPATGAPEIAPWKEVRLDPDYGGLWLVAGDLDGDGAVELLSAENYNDGDVHYTSAVVAQELDGTVLWRWGNPDIGRKKWHHDVACQIHDWDGDGVAEVVLCDKGAIVSINAVTGQEKRRIKIDQEATDCLVFCDLSGLGRPTDVIVKTRYTKLWAYSQQGKELWSVELPGGYRTAHQPRPIDVDKDGRDEIMAGYAMLNPDGSVRWIFESKKADLKNGHLDCARLLRDAKKPEEMRIALTCCGANNIAVVDGNGKLQWEQGGHHFESITIGNILPDAPAPQILVDIDHVADAGPLWIIDAEGNHRARLTTKYSRHHRLVDWDGDGFEEIVVGQCRGIYNHSGALIGVFKMSDREGDADFETSVLTGDMNGDGRKDVVYITPNTAYIYLNENGEIESPKPPLGFGLNVTLY